MQRNIRVFFSKTGRAKYIAHLDMMRCWTRTLTRAELPIWYTEGFNPHAYMTFTLPLSLGFESECEYMDTRLIEDVPLDEVKDRLNAVLPVGFHVYKVADMGMDQKVIMWSDYHIKFDCENPEDLLEKFTSFISQDSIIVKKKSKKGMLDVDIKDKFKLLESATEPDCVVLKMRFAAGITSNVNPTLLVENFPCKDEIQQAYYRRIAVLTEDLKHFE